MRLLHRRQYLAREEGRITEDEMRALRTEQDLDFSEPEGAPPSSMRVN